MAQNYWTMKDSELTDLVDEYKLDVDVKEKFDRKAVISALKKYDVATGKATDIIEEDEDGNIVDVDKTVPTTKVIFHNIGENDLPYVPCGLNGKFWYIPKEKEVTVPTFILKACIKYAVETHDVPTTGPDGRIRWAQKRVQRFPYSIV